MAALAMQVEVVSHIGVTNVIHVVYVLYYYSGMLIGEYG